MKSKYKVIYTPEASEDLKGIYYHIAKRLLAPRLMSGDFLLPQFCVSAFGAEQR